MIVHGRHGGAVELQGWLRIMGAKVPLYAVLDTHPSEGAALQMSTDDSSITLQKAGATGAKPAAQSSAGASKH